MIVFIARLRIGPFGKKFLYYMIFGYLRKLIFISFLTGQSALFGQNTGSLKGNHNVQTAEGKAIYELAKDLNRQGNYDSALILLESKYPKIIDEGKSLDLIQLLILKGHTLLNIDDISSATKLSKQLIKEIKNHNNIYLKSQIAIFSGRLHLKTKEFKIAQDHFENAEQLSLTTKNQTLTVMALNGLGNALLGQGKDQLASGSFSQSLNIGKQLNDTLNICYALIGLAEISLSKKKPTEALEFLNNTKELSKNFLDSRLKAEVFEKYQRYNFTENTTNDKHIQNTRGNYYIEFGDNNNAYTPSKLERVQNHNYRLKYDFEQPFYTENYWSITKGKHDLFYIGNDLGPNFFNGNYTKIPDYNWESKNTYAIETNKNGEVFLGGDNHFGFIEINSTGAPNFISLEKHLNKELQDYVKVTHIGFEGNSVLFSGPKYLLKWQNDSLSLLKQHGPQKVFTVGNQTWVWQKSFGLFRMEDGQLSKAFNGDQWANLEIEKIVSFGKEKILIGTADVGLFVFDGITNLPMKGEIQEVLTNLTLSTLVELGENEIGVGTIEGGLIIMDKNGQIKHQFNQSNGLKNNHIRDLYFDDQQILWLVHKNGIQRIEYPSGLSSYDMNQGLTGGAIHCLSQIKEDLFIGAQNGLFKTNITSRLDSVYTNGKLEQFIKIENVTGICRSMSVIGNELFIASSTGIYHYTSEKVLKLGDTHATYIYRSKCDTTIIYVGLANGLASLVFENNQWVYKGKFEGMSDKVNSMSEDRDSGLCIGTDNGIWRLNLKEKIPILKHYGPEHGAAQGNCHIFTFENRIIAQKEIGGINLFDEYSERFSENFDVIFKKIGNVEFFFQTSRSGQNYFVNSVFRDHYDIFNQNSDTLLTSEGIKYWPKDIRRMGPSLSMFQDSQRRLWMGFQDGSLYCYDDKLKPKVLNPPFKCHLRKVYVGENTVRLENDSKDLIQFTMPFSPTRFGFEFSSVAFDCDNTVDFVCWLEGFEPRPIAIEWKKEKVVQYSNLREGSYAFHVQARNILNQISEEAIYRFNIRPPWYRTWWIYCIYALLFIACVFMFIRWRTQRQLAKLKIQYEAKIKVEYEKEKQEKEKEILRLQMIENQLKALRSQMNPHFIFNAMTAIQNLVLKGEYDNALNSLSDFSRMIRKLLDHSDIKEISLKEELAFISAYLQLENLRFEHKFSSEIILDLDLDPEGIFLPPMIIQPYLENAVKHGVLHLKKNGKIILEIKMVGDLLHCAIEDNGLGRDYTNSKKPPIRGQSEVDHKSMGMSITKKRLELLNNQGQMKIFLKIIDLKDKNGDPCGTRVELQIPVEIEN